MCDRVYALVSFVCVFGWYLLQVPTQFREDTLSSLATLTGSAVTPTTAAVTSREGSFGLHGFYIPLGPVGVPRTLPYALNAPTTSKNLVCPLPLFHYSNPLPAPSNLLLALFICSWESFRPILMLQSPILLVGFDVLVPCCPLSGACDAGAAASPAHFAGGQSRRGQDQPHLCAGQGLGTQPGSHQPLRANGHCRLTGLRFACRLQQHRWHRQWYRTRLG